jgi:hypothetical protein
MNLEIYQIIFKFQFMLPNNFFYQNLMDAKIAIVKLFKYLF